jgi:hypothetical protein
MAWRLHVAVPTPEGWRYVTSIDGTNDRVTREIFGTSINDAVQTLSESISAEPDAAARFVMATWLARLAG